MIADKFIEFEVEEKLFEKNINGFHYWVYIRNTVYNDIIRNKNNEGQAHTDLGNVSELKKSLIKLKNARYWVTNNSLWFLKKRDILVLNHQRRVKEGEFFDCVYTETLLNEIDYSYYVFESPTMEEKHYRPIRTKNIKYFDYINILVRYKKKFYRKFLKFALDLETENYLKELRNNLNYLFEVEISSNRLYNLVENQYLQYIVAKKYYAKLLDKVQPKVIVEVISYTFSRFILNEVAKERGIKVIELQHGHMRSDHVAYNYLEKCVSPALPDYYFLYGDLWKDVARLPVEPDNVKVVGWQYLENKVEYYKKQKRDKSDKKTIIFLSQGTVGKELSKLALETLNLLDKEKFGIIYKLHPGEYARWKTEYPWLVDADIEVVDNGELPLHHYLYNSEIQIGTDSTSVFEGLAYNLRTIILKINNFRYITELDGKENVFLATNAEEIVEFCKIYSNIKSELDINYYWKNNANKNIINELDKIISETK